MEVSWKGQFGCVGLGKVFRVYLYDKCVGRTAIERYLMLLSKHPVEEAYSVLYMPTGENKKGQGLLQTWPDCASSHFKKMQPLLAEKSHASDSSQNNNFTS